ncbi:MAG: hypothetical protein Unbinned6046contig1000_70 [Prokaryotic dsDNA virus sp.]|nr:MAG: hypothetical protein Unbinned6046contig1000_70 [Prokaryotic dsDNA virus sp.]|tara:strand:- start:798 stop:1397 length:600 start_codon:yes stop_codon:yes gene_type:complete
MSNLKYIKMEKCNDCDHEIDYDNEYSRETQDGQILCESCADAVWDHPPTLISFGHHEHEEGKKFYWSKEFGFANEYLEELWGDTEQTLPINGFEYVRTDAWRGYYKPEIRDEFTSFDGWYTGWVDETISHKLTLNQFLDDLGEQHLDLYFPIWVIMSPTSNVFSQSTDIMIKKADLDRFEDLLFNNYGITSNELKNSLK